MSTILVILCLVVLMLLHESAHVVAAKLLHLKVEQIGISMTPFPHFFVAISDVPDGYIQYLFMFSGIATTCIILTILWASELLLYRFLYTAIAVQFMADTNPFYSDFTLTFGRKYKYGLLWYAHFCLWGYFLYLFLRGFRSFETIE